MAIRASVQPLAEPGHALLRISELEAAPEGLMLSIQRQQGPDSHLADDGWRRTETWLQPEHVARRREALEFHLGPEICDRLAGIAAFARLSTVWCSSRPCPCRFIQAGTNQSSFDASRFRSG